MLAWLLNVLLLDVDSFSSDATYSFNSPQSAAAADAILMLQLGDGQILHH